MAAGPTRARLLEVVRHALEGSIGTRLSDQELIAATFAVAEAVGVLILDLVVERLSGTSRKTNQGDDD